MKKIYTVEFFKKAGKEGAEVRNKKHNPSEISKRGWVTRKKNAVLTKEK